MVDEHGVDNTAHLDKVLPFAAVASKARNLPSRHSADLTQADIGDHAFEALSGNGTRCRATEVIVDHLDVLPAELLKPLWEDDEARVIAEVTEVIEKHVGTRPTGWMGPGALESNVTPDLLKEAGYTHLLDWPFDDQPIWMRTRAGPLLSVPYPMELNDAGTLVWRDHTARQFAEMIVDQFEEMLEASERQPLVFALSLHGFIVGQPFRLRPLRQAIKHCVEHKMKDRVWFTRAGDIAKYCFSLRKGLIPGS